MSRYDVIILGAGGFGSSAAYQAARRGKKVLLIDQFERGHDRGSSHGETRIIRKAYFEHPDYVPLLQQAYKMWQKLEDMTGRDLFTPCGLMLAGDAETEAISGTRRAAEEHCLELEEVSPNEFEDRFPGFEFPENFDVVYEVEGGFLNVEECVHTYLDLAEAKGAEFIWETPVTHWESDGTTVKVFTAEQKFEADTLIVTAGPWASQLLADIPGFPQIQVLRKVMLWFPVVSDAYDLAMGGSGFFFEMPYGQFYGFPSVDGESIKVCQHTDGILLEDPAEFEMELREEETELVIRFLKEVMPAVVPKVEQFAPCMYSMTPDGHFVVDTHPEFANVVFGAGFSGHGFKFVSVLGKALVELALDRETELPIEFLRLDRFAEGA